MNGGLSPRKGLLEVIGAVWTKARKAMHKYTTILTQPPRSEEATTRVLDTTSVSCGTRRLLRVVIDDVGIVPGSEAQVQKETDKRLSANDYENLDNWIQGGDEEGERVLHDLQGSRWTFES